MLEYERYLKRKRRLEKWAASRRREKCLAGRCLRAAGVFLGCVAIGLILGYLFGESF